MTRARRSGAGPGGRCARATVSSVNEHWVDYTFGARLDVSLTRALHVLGDVSAQRVPIDWGDRDGRTAQATINLTYIYAPQD